MPEWWLLSHIWERSREHSGQSSEPQPGTACRATTSPQGKSYLLALEAYHVFIEHLCSGTYHFKLRVPHFTPNPHNSATSFVALKDCEPLMSHHKSLTSVLLDVFLPSSEIRIIHTRVQAFSNQSACFSRVSKEWSLLQTKFKSHLGQLVYYNSNIDIAM